MTIKGLKKILIIIIGLIAIFSMSFGIYAATQEKTDIICEDINLFNALKNELPNNLLISSNINTKTISIPTETLKTITKLELDNNEITNLTGLEKFTELTELNLSNNNITSIEALKDMQNLTILNLGNNRLLGNNINIISNFKSLKQAYLSNDGISTVDFMTGLTSLEIVDLSRNNVGNLKPIQNLTAIKELNMSDNRNLVSLDYIKIHTNLTKLNIANTSITDLSGIKDLRNLVDLNVRSLNNVQIYPIVETYYNEATEETEAYLRKLKKLDISYTMGLSFSQLSYLKQLNELYMLGCELYDIYGIIDLTNLNYINVEENHINDISPLIEIEYDNNGNPYVSRRSNVRKIVFKNNEISDIRTLSYIGDLDYADLSENHIYNIQPLSSKTLKEGLYLQNQTITIEVYDKEADVDQYMILPNIFQQSKNPSSRVTCNSWSLKNTELNKSEGYETVNNYNVIIDKNRTSDDEITIKINGGNADGTILTYVVSQDSNAIDSLYFKDEKLCEAIYDYLLAHKEDYTTLLRAKNILNIEQIEISRVDTLNISSYGITNLEGLESFINLQRLYASGNEFITIAPLEYCTNLTELNVSNNAIGDNNKAILKMKQLASLDISNTQINSIKIINDFVNSFEEGSETELKSLNVSLNHINNIDGLEKITTLESLYIANNKIKDISKIKSLENLKLLNVSSNEIKDISAIKDISTIRTLNISKNQIKDISSVNSRITSLDFSGNKVKDITPLSKMTSLTDLIMDDNLIEDISNVESLYIKNSFSAKQQKITRTLNNDQSEIANIELPKIFTQAKQSSSKVYTATDFELNNCTISGNNVIVNINELGDTIASVKIVDGKAKGTTLFIAGPIKSEIKYNIEKPTNQDVIATISFDRNNVTITNNKGSNQYKFVENGSFTFEYEDENGFIGQNTAKVDWIDKDVPEITIKYSETNLTNKEVTVTITSNEEIQEVTGWVLSTDKKTLTKTYSQNTTEEITVRDLVGNEAKQKITIKNIDKAAPTLKIEYKIDTGDAICLLRHIAQEKNSNTASKHPTWKLSEEKILAGDINKNGQIDLGDAIIIQRYIAAKSSQEIANKHPEWLNI